MKFTRSIKLVILTICNLSICYFSLNVVHTGRIHYCYDFLNPTSRNIVLSAKKRGSVEENKFSIKKQISLDKNTTKLMQEFPTQQLEERVVSNINEPSVDYVVGSMNIDSLSEIGLNISNEILSRNFIPYHLTTPADLFCNRELNLKQIQVIGFDMDWTLALYNKEFDMLAYEGAKEKLIQWLQYPKEVNGLEYEMNICRRGCIIDKKRGNILKLDQHRYVRMVEHGMTGLSRSERKSIYRESYQEFETFSGSNFVNIDTPFSLVDACLYLQLVHLKDQISSNLSSYLLKDNNEGESQKEATRLVQFASKSYLQLWSDMRKCVDRCHKDGVIKLKVAQDPAKYIIYDPKIFPMLDQFRSVGKKVFLLTNSLWDYTQVVMNYLEGRKQSNEQRDFQWMDHFDLVIVGSNKPAFLLDEGSLSLYRIQPETGKLKNVEDRWPSNSEESARFLQKNGKLFQGGNAQILHRLLDMPLGGGDCLLYVGDHIYSDILRSKRSLGWRTCLIVPELTNEIVSYKKFRLKRKEVQDLRKAQYLLEDFVEKVSHHIRRHRELVLMRVSELEATNDSSKQDKKKKRSYAFHRHPTNASSVRTDTATSTASPPSAILDDEGGGGVRESFVHIVYNISSLQNKSTVRIILRNQAAPSHNERGLSELKIVDEAVVRTVSFMIQKLRNDQHEHEDDAYRMEASSLDSGRMVISLQELEDGLQTLRSEIRMKLDVYDKSFHSRWGQLFKAGFQESRFAKQVKDYACLYTSKASNLGLVSPLRSFRPVRDRMAHDHFLEGF